MNPERVLTLTQIKPENLERPKSLDLFDKAEIVKQLFVDLPIANGTNLEFLSPLIPDDIEEDRLREQVNNRYLDLLNLRKSFGQFEPPKISIEMAISILDDKLFEAVKKETKAEGKVLATARHEIGHQLVATNLGWSTQLVTVVPASYYLGLTVVSPPQSRNFDELLLESAAISFGGAIAAQMSADEVRGIGADMASAQAKARIAATFSIYPSEESFLSEAAKIAHQALRNVGPKSLNNQAQQLLVRKTIA